MSLTVCLQCPECKSTLFDGNITHNLGEMARAADAYDELWRPEEIGIKVAQQLIAPLRASLMRLNSSSDYFERFNPSNGWGNYQNLVKFITDYTAACIEHPKATIEVSR